MKLYIEDGGELSLLGEIMSMSIPVSTGREIKGEVEFLVSPRNDEHRPKIGHMSKKRFVKLLMSIGYNRNEAISLASAHRSAGYSYASAMCILLNRYMENLNDAMKKIPVQLRYDY